MEEGPGRTNWAPEAASRTVAIVPSVLRRSAVAVLWNVGVAAAYFAGAELGLLDQLLRGHLTPFWPSTGIALAALLLLGWRVAPGIAVGAFIALVFNGMAIYEAVPIAIGDMLAPMLACYLLHRVKFHPNLDRLRDGLALVFLGAFAAMTVSASVGTSVLLLSGEALAQTRENPWLLWWMGNATGVLVVTPLLLLLHKPHRPGSFRLARVGEIAVLLAGTFVVAGLGSHTRFEVLFLVFPFLFWAAWRFQLAGSAPCVLIASVVVTLAAEGRTGSFAGGHLLTELVTLQAFNASAALTGLLLAALISERNHTYREVERAVMHLSDVMSLRDRAGRHAESWRPPSREDEARM